MIYFPLNKSPTKSTTATTIEMEAPAPTTTTTFTKLRLMCSYGGQIIPRQNTNSLYYTGGDSRIITLPTLPTSLSSFTSHLSTSLHFSKPFSVKYLLPDHDLHSLVSLFDDDDLILMLHHHLHRISPPPPRIRLFLFPLQPQSPKPPSNLPESWFVDALKSAGIMQREGVLGISGSGGGEGSIAAESIVLETTSSFGSTSSSASLSNLPAKGAQGDSDSSVATAVSHPQTGTYQDTAGSSVMMENKVSSNLLESDGKVPDAPAEVELHKPVKVSGFPLSLQFDQALPQQVPFVHMGAGGVVPVHYVPQNVTYYVMNSQVPEPQVYYQTSQPQPIYFVPVAHHYNFPVQSGLVNTPTISLNRPPVHPISSANPIDMAYKVTSGSPKLAPEICRTTPMTSSIIDMPHYENSHHIGGFTQMNYQAKPAGIACVEPAILGNELDDDSLRAQIYKSQPPPPTLPSQYQTMTNATTALLSGACAQLHTDNS